MTTLRYLTIVAALLAGGTSLAIAQNGLPTGGEHPVAGTGTGPTGICITTIGLTTGIGITKHAVWNDAALHPWGGCVWPLQLERVPCLPQ
jgi:hypothetical protein